MSYQGETDRMAAGKHLGLVAVDLEIDLRRVRSVGAEHARELRLPVGGNDEGAKRRRDIRRRLALQRLQYWNPPVLPSPLLCALRRIGLHHTPFVKATCGTIDAMARWP